jgi:hypothetical protein
MPSVNVPLIILGCIGGLLPDVLRLVKGRYKGFSSYWREPSYWLGLMLLIALGGFAAWIGEAKEAVQALAYGFGAPEVITKLLSSGPEETAVRGAREFSLRSWWAS